MAKQTINIGASPNDGTGTPLRTSFDYCNLNFTELYTAVGPSGNNIVCPGSATITGNLTVDTNTFFVDSANNRVGIGTATPAYPLSVAGRISYAGAIGEGPDTTVSSSGTSLLFGNSATWTETQFFASGNLQYRVQSSGVFTWLDGAGGTRMTLNATGLGVGVTPSAGKGALQLSSGINFPATQVASSDANTLDDYEEGTFTPTIVGATTAGTGTYSNQNGYYTKVGRLVTITVYLNWTAHTGTGDMRFANFPFTSANVVGNYNGINIAFLNNIALTAGNVLYGSIPFGFSYAAALQCPVGGGVASAVPMDTTGEIAFTATYFV